MSLNRTIFLQEDHEDQNMTTKNKTQRTGEGEKRKSEINHVDNRKATNSDLKNRGGYEFAIGIRLSGKGEEQ